MVPPDATKADTTSPEWIEANLAPIVAKLESGEPFAHASYRDGEWSAILGLGGTNCDGTEMTPELGGLLADSLRGAKGIQAAFWPRQDVGARTREMALTWLEAERPDVHWLADCPIRRANEVGLAAPFFRALRGRQVYLVGTDHMMAGGRLPFTLRRGLGVPGSTAWMWVEDTAGEIVGSSHPTDVILLAAGMASELMIHSLWDGTRTIIDVGAILDPYAGVYSRNVYRSEHWRREIMPKNLP